MLFILGRTIIASGRTNRCPRNPGELKYSRLVKFFGHVLKSLNAANVTHWKLPPIATPSEMNALSNDLFRMFKSNELFVHSRNRSRAGHLPDHRRGLRRCLHLCHPLQRTVVDRTERPPSLERCSPNDAKMSGTQATFSQAA